MVVIGDSGCGGLTRCTDLEDKGMKEDVDARFVVAEDEAESMGLENWCSGVRGAGA